MECHKRISREYAQANKEKVAAAKAAYRLANLEQIKEKVKQRRADNPEKIKAQKAKQAAIHSKKIVERVKEWRKANPEAKRIESHNYRARKRESGGVLSKGLSKKLFALQKGLCACCRKPLGDDYHMDHIMPVARGGPNVDSNIQLLRSRCNSQKNAKHPVDFMQERGFLL